MPEKQQQPYSGSLPQKKRSLMWMRGVYCVSFIAFCLRRCDGGDWLCQPLCRDGNVQPLFMQMVRLGFHRLPPPLPLPLPLPLLSLLVLLILVLVLRLSGWLCLADLQAGHTGRSGLAVSYHRARSIQPLSFVMRRRKKENKERTA